MVQSQQEILENDQFATDTIEAVSFAREAYSRIIEEKCPGSKAVTAVSSVFGIHRKLAWQIIKVAYAEDPFVAAKHMPSSKSMGAWIKAAESCGIENELVESIRDAETKFQTLIQTHATSKSEFDILLESSNNGSDAQSEERWRQHSFAGNSFTWGAHCRVLMAMCVLMPSDDMEDYFHMAQIRGLMDYRQTRPGVRWLVNQSIAVDDDVQHETAMQRVSIDVEAARAHNGVPVLPEFCSQPMLELMRSETPDGMMQDEFVSSGVGLLGQRTLVTGEILRNIAPTHAMPNDKTAHFGTGVRIPTEMLHFDMYVKVGLFGDVERELRVFSDIGGTVTFSDSDALSVSDSISKLGRGLSLTQSPELPGYREMSKDVFNRLGLDPDEYELFRIKMAYPPMPASVMFKHELLPKDGKTEK